MFLNSSILLPESPFFILKVDHHFVRVPEKQGILAWDVCELKKVRIALSYKSKRILLHCVVEQLVYRHVGLLKVVHVPQTISWW